MYHRSSQIKFIKDWLDPLSRVPWREIEENLAGKYRLQDILFSGLNNKQCLQTFGLIMAYTVVNFKLMEKCINFSHIWHTHTPIWYNNNIRSGGITFFSRDWMQKGIHTLKDIAGPKRLLSFQKLCDRYGPEPSSLFLYLHLRSAMKAYGVPWGKHFLYIQSLLGLNCPLLVTLLHGCTGRP